MQDIIRKIIEIDHMAQKMTDEALSLKSEAEASIGKDKEALKEKYLEKARIRIAKRSETEEQFLIETLEDISTKYDAVSKKLNNIYELNHSKWVDELYNKMIGG